MASLMDFQVVAWACVHHPANWCRFTGWGGQRFPKSSKIGNLGAKEFESLLQWLADKISMGQCNERHKLDERRDKTWGGDKLMAISTILCLVFSWFLCNFLPPKSHRCCLLFSQSTHKEIKILSYNEMILWINRATSNHTSSPFLLFLSHLPSDG